MHPYYVREWKDNDSRDQEGHPLTDITFEVPKDRLPLCPKCQGALSYVVLNDLREKDEGYDQGATCDGCGHIIERNKKGLWHCETEDCDFDQCWDCADVTQIWFTSHYSSSPLNKACETLGK